MTHRQIAFALLVAGAVTAGGWAAIRGATAQQQAGAAMAPAPRAVRIETLAEVPALQSRHFVGRLEPESTVDIAFQVSGQVLEILPEEGARVAEGSLLARLDAEDYRLSLKDAEAVVTLARSEAARSEELVARKVTPQAQLDRTQAELAQAEVALDQARRALEQTEIRAPFEALVARELVAPYAYTTPSAPVLRLQDVSQMLVAVSLPEDLAVRARTSPDDFEAVARFPALPGLAVPLRLDRFVTEVNTVAQTYTLRLALTEIDPRLLPGMTATVEIRPRKVAATVSVPASAIDATSAPAPQVWVVDEENRVTPRPVQLGLPAGERVIVADGLTPGDRVVAAGWRSLTPGEPVRPARF